jgi:ryanodine receptor 2
MNSTPDMLPNHFLPVSTKIAQATRHLYSKEQQTLVAMRTLESSEREEMMLELQAHYEVLIRNLYAFYPLLIKYVDLHKAYWLKNPDESTELLYYNCSEVCHNSYSWLNFWLAFVFTFFFTLFI